MTDDQTTEAALSAVAEAGPSASEAVAAGFRQLWVTPRNGENCTLAPDAVSKPRIEAVHL
jgi:hypothetical protein